jgi:mono/diheme cytochrome c family protein
MNFFERIPTRWLLAGAGVACLALWAAPSSAQTSGDPQAGEALFADVANIAAMPSVVFNNCTDCHGSVQERRIHIGGSPFADISFDTAAARLRGQISAQAADQMGQYRALSGPQIADIAAYIADTPKVTATGLSALNTLAFSASASGVGVSKSLTIRHSLATGENLQIKSVSLASGTSAFTRGNQCPTNMLLAPAGTCTFSVSYTPSSTAAESKLLTITMQQGTVSFTRTITLNGSLAGVTQPSAPAPADDSGGGALGGLWLSGLALATAMLARRRRV